MKRLFFVIAAGASIVVGCVGLWMDMSAVAIATRCVAVFAATYVAAVIVSLAVAVPYVSGGRKTGPSAARQETRQPQQKSQE